MKTIKTGKNPLRDKNPGKDGRNDCQVGLGDTKTPASFSFILQFMFDILNKGSKP